MFNDIMPIVLLALAGFLGALWAFPLIKFVLIITIVYAAGVWRGIDMGAERTVEIIKEWQDEDR